MGHSFVVRDMARALGVDWDGEVSIDITSEEHVREIEAFLHSEHGDAFHRLFVHGVDVDLDKLFYNIVCVFSIPFPEMFQEPIHPYYTAKYATYLPERYVIHAVETDVQRMRMISPLLIAYSNVLQGLDPGNFEMGSMLEGAERLLARIMYSHEALVFDKLRVYSRDWTAHYSLRTVAEVVARRALPVDPRLECVNPMELLRRNGVPKHVMFVVTHGVRVVNKTFFLLFSGMYRIDEVVATPLEIVEVLRDQNLLDLSVDGDTYEGRSDRLARYGIVPETLLQACECWSEVDDEPLFDECDELPSIVANRQAERRMLRMTLEEGDTIDNITDIITSYAPPRYTDIHTFISPVMYLDSMVWEKRLAEFIQAREYYHSQRAGILQMYKLATPSTLEYLRNKIASNEASYWEKDDSYWCVVS